MQPTVQQRYSVYTADDQWAEMTWSHYFQCDLAIYSQGFEMFKEAMSTNRSEVSGGHMIRLWWDTVGEMKVNVTVSDLSVLCDSCLPTYSSIIKNNS